MEWLLIIGAIVVFLAYGDARNRSKPKKVRTQGTRRTRTPREPDSAAPRQAFGRRNELSGNSGLARWVPAGEPVTVGPFNIDCGMFYLGVLLPGQTEGQCGNCVVDPNSRISTSTGKQVVQPLSYWPSYQRATPTVRRAYLAWLSSGRNDPAVDIGYVFLFFYGLERRLFVDGARSEAPMLIAEVQRLLQVYGDDGTFRSYALRFLDAASLMTSFDVRRPVLSPDLRAGYEMPLAVKVYLGRKLAANLALDAEDVLAWVVSLPDTSLRTPATRCFAELVELWRYRFDARYPEGIKVNTPKTRISLEYRAASGGFTSEIKPADTSGSIPDIGTISAPVAALKDMLAACTEELSPYSRLLGKNPAARCSLDASLLLPRELAHAARADAGRNIDDLLQGRSAASVTLGKLAQALLIDISGMEKIPTAVGNQIGVYLDHLDIGFEPDRRYGAGPLQPEGHVVVFNAEGGGKVDGNGPAFAAARAMVDVAALAAGSDSRVEGGEIDAITAEIRNVPGLGQVERARLIAYASTLLKDTSLHRFALQKLKTLDPSAKQAVVRSATAAILADGHASPAEVKFLERLFKAMNLPVDEVYSMLHRSAVIIDEPVSVASEQRTKGVPIPPQPGTAPASDTLRIDHSRLERLKSETSAVSQLLAGIFVEDEDPAVTPVPSTPVAGNSRYGGLDAAHAALLGEVLLVGHMTRAIFDEKARALRLLPEGAVEVINEWGFDRFDGPILDGDDPLTVESHIRANLTNAEATA